MSTKYNVPSGANAIPKGLYWLGLVPMSATGVPGTVPYPGSGWPSLVTQVMEGLPMKLLTA